MRRVVKQLAVVVFAGTMFTLLAMQAYLSTNSHRSTQILQSRLSVRRDVKVVGKLMEYESLDLSKDGSYEPTESSDLATREADFKNDHFTRRESYTRKHSATEKPTYPTAENISVDEKEQNDEDDPAEDTTGPPDIQAITQIMKEQEQKKQEFVVGSSEMIKKICPEYPSELVGRLEVNATYEPSEKEALKAGGPSVDGCFEPDSCVPRQTIAIIIPYKDRLTHLITLMYHLHPILQRQSIRYCVFVAEQFDNGAFNKARVMNAAFKEITTNHRLKFDCVIFHDVDMLLEDDRNLHTCTKMPKHLSPAIDKFNYTLNYGTKFGGVTAISVENYKKANGHSNNFWGWGGEDNDMEMRIARSNLSITITNTTYGRYKMIPHEHPWWFSPLYGVGSYLQSKKHWSTKVVDDSGLDDFHYSLRFTTQHKLWTKLTVDIRTILVEKAIVRFRGYSAIGQLEFISPSYKTEQRYSSLAKNGIVIPPEDKNCSYIKFVNKTVNKTLGIRERIKYGRMYNSLEEAQKICNQMRTYCGSVVEEHPGRFSLRATAYLHENYLRYRTGMVKQREIIEEHHTRSVHVKTCPGSTSYLDFFRQPVVMAGDSKTGPSPAYSIEFKIRVFYDINTTLFYSGDIMTAHKAILQETADAGIVDSSPWDTMGNVYSSKVKILNTSDPISLSKNLPEGYKSLEGVVKNGDGIITVQTPLSGLLRYPGCYVCRSTLIDANGAALLQWKWWFELRAKTMAIEEDILENQLDKAKTASIDFTDTVEKRRKMWLSYHEKLKSSGDKRGMPDRILNLVRKATLDVET